MFVIGGFETGRFRTEEAETGRWLYGVGWAASCLSGSDAGTGQADINALLEVVGERQQSRRSAAKT